MNSVSLSDCEFAVVDVETTGLNAINHRITEIAIVKVKDSKIVSVYSTLINPQQFIPRHITDLTGITNEMVFDKPDFKTIYPEIRSQFTGNSEMLIFTGHNVSFDFRFINSSAEREGLEKLEHKALCTSRLARRLKLSIRSKSLSNLARYLGVPLLRQHRALYDAKATAGILIRFIEMLKLEQEIETADELLKYQFTRVFSKLSMPRHIKRVKPFLRELPHDCGVYYMLDKQNEIIYIGKAKNLHNRVHSYFYNNTSHSSKVLKMIRNVHNIEFEKTGSELSALLLETKMIKKLKPKFNSAIKRHRDYPFIRIDTQNDFPKVILTYEVKPDGAKYFGPFKSSYFVSSLLENIYKTFSIRRCDDKILRPSYSRTPCMYHQMNQCGAPCNFTQSVTEYRKESVKAVNMFKSETSKGAIKQLERQMFEYSEQMYYEDAAYIRDKINDLNRILINLELLSSEITLQNYVIKCFNENRNEHEIFFISSGRIAKCININCNISTELKKNISEDIKNIYYRGNLFGQPYFNKSGKFSIEEIDKMKIMFNWIYFNNQPEKLKKITNKTNAEEILEFVTNQ